MSIPTSDLENRFSYHSANNKDVVDSHEAIREACGELAHFINLTVPDGREKALAITKLEEVMFWANAGIARNNNE